MIPEIEIKETESCETCIFMEYEGYDCMNQEHSGFGEDSYSVRGEDSSDCKPCKCRLEWSDADKILNWFILNRNKIVEVEE